MNSSERHKVTDEQLVDYLSAWSGIPGVNVEQTFPERSTVHPRAPQAPQLPTPPTPSKEQLLSGVDPEIAAKAQEIVREHQARLLASQLLAMEMEVSRPDTEKHKILSRRALELNAVRALWSAAQQVANDFHGRGIRPDAVVVLRDEEGNTKEYKGWIVQNFMKGQTVETTPCRADGMKVPENAWIIDENGNMHGVGFRRPEHPDNSGDVAEVLGKYAAMTGRTLPRGPLEVNDNGANDFVHLQSFWGASIQGVYDRYKF